jgi:hypothetical protein
MASAKDSMALGVSAKGNWNVPEHLLPTQRLNLTMPESGWAEMARVRSGPRASRNHLRLLPWTGSATWTIVPLILSFGYGPS